MRGERSKVKIPAITAYPRGGPSRRAKAASVGPGRLMPALHSAQGVHFQEGLHRPDYVVAVAYVLPMELVRSARGSCLRTSMLPSTILVSYTGCGWAAGPRRTVPVSRSNTLPCQGQVMHPRSTTERHGRSAASWVVQSPDRGALGEGRPPVGATVGEDMGPAGLFDDEQTDPGGGTA